MKVLAQGCQGRRAIKQSQLRARRDLGAGNWNKKAVHREFTLSWGKNQPISPTDRVLGNTYERRRDAQYPGGSYPTLALKGQATFELTAEIRRSLTEGSLSARLR